MHHSLPLSLALTAVWAHSLSLGAQEPIGSVPDQPATYWAVNVGAAMAAAWLQARGQRSGLPRVIAAGFAGGSIVYAGQRVVGAHDARLRLAGVELAAVGASMTRNIARGQRPLAELTLPFFPFYLRVRTQPEVTVRLRLSAAALLSTVRLAATYEQAPNLGRWLTSGAPVFAVPGQRLQCREHDRTSCVTEVVGQHMFGAVAHATDGEACLPHEFGHVAQDVRDAVLFAVPASDYALRRTGPVGRWLARYLVIDGLLPLMLLNTTVGERQLGCATGSFYECEVNRLAR